MKHVIAIAFICAALATSACSRFDESVAAYENRDYATALWEWRRLARLGYAPAQNNLAVAYYNGAGVPKDLVQAYKWADLATARAYEPARDNREAIAGEMTPSQLAEARQMVRDWLRDYRYWR
jgi:TPR repeat protein